MAKRLFDPRSLIPSSAAVERQLQELRSHVEALEYLLHVAQEVECRLSSPTGNKQSSASNSEGRADG